MFVAFVSQNNVNNWKSSILTNSVVDLMCSMQ
jgi:hypothetical protein